MQGVKGFFASKINWAQIISVVCMMLTMVGFDLTSEDQAQIVAAIVAVNGAITVIMRVFFTNKKIQIGGA